MKKHNSRVSDDSLVIIKPEAYYTMLVHVLRFGAKTRNRREFKEVMGMLIGRLEGDGKIKDVIVEDAVPVSHGGSIEVRFAPQDYVKFSTIDEQFSKKNWFTVGWYHSHPALDIFFSSTDIRNQLGWQTANPSAIGIVFDHTYLEKPGDLGFRTFRLDDPSKGEASGYHEVKTKVEEPDSVDFYNKIIELISSIHTREPPILELNEKSNLLGDIIFPSDGELRIRQPEINTDRILNNVKNGLFNVIETLMGPFISHYNSWSQNLLKQSSNQNLSIKRNLVNLKNVLNDQLNGIQERFNNNIRDLLNDLDFYIDDKFDGLDDKIEKIDNSFKNFKKDINKKLNQTLANLVEKNSDKLDKDFQGILKIYEDIKENASNTEELNTNQDEILKNLIKQPKEIPKTIQNEVENHFLSLNKDFEEKSNELFELIDDSDKRADKLQSKLSDSLSLLETTVEPLKEKISNLNTDKKVLQNKIDKANSKIKEKEKQIESLENENKNLNDEIKKEKKEKEKLLDKIKKLEKKVEKNE